MWFGEFCSFCCLSLLPQLACSIFPTMYKDFFRALYMKVLSPFLKFFFLSVSEMAGSIEPAAERPSFLRAMPISVSQAQKVCGKPIVQCRLKVFGQSFLKILKKLDQKILQLLFHSKVSHWRFPDCSLRDKILHLFFVFCVLVMIACAAVTIICFKEVREQRSYLWVRGCVEIMMVGCGCGSQ